MLKEPYSEKSYTNHSNYIGNRLALRPPQKESLERFARIVDTLSLSKTPNLGEELLRIRELFPTLTSFEREFPSVCFSLATGIGKTRLMGAFIAYLHYEKEIRNFFVMAPNLTIYKKLKADLGDPNSSKYVFRGLDKFVESPRIIDGDNYEDFRRQQRSLLHFGVMINVFNISKLNSESGRMRRLNEVLGQSYFEYLQSLPDLCIMMDESHHYHADRGFETINELHPILGVELTATPQIQKGSRKIDFSNVVYEYSLASALNDGLYVKVPVVVTRKDFRPEEYSPAQLDQEKLNDGIRIQETKSRLDVYARTFNRAIIKPFVLVVAKDTAHSSTIMAHLTSDAFRGGYYRDKVLEINSSQRGSEKDDNIDKLLSLENPGNLYEIVIHVNMLKEGWDVTNLYTIIPLRVSASETLTEQTIGRGLRLPYGQRTGDDAVDRLSIVSHDRYEAIIALANSPDSLVRRIHYIDPAEPDSADQRETVPMPALYDEITGADSFVEQLAATIRETASEDFIKNKTTPQTLEVARFVAKQASKTVIELGRQVKNLDAAKDEEISRVIRISIVNETIRRFSEMELKREDLTAAIEEAVVTCVQALTEHVIPVPRVAVQPFIEVKRGFYNFKLDTRNIKWHPSDDTLIGTELQEGGETFEFEVGSAIFTKTDTVENEITRYIIVHDNIDYNTCAELIYSLIADAKNHFLSYLNTEECEKVMRGHQRALAEIIYAQMNEHFYKEETNYSASAVKPFTPIEKGFGSIFKSDDLYDLRATIPASEVKTKVFKGFKKACHTLYKFDSDTERRFAIILENDGSVIRWMRPSPKQFNIYYGPSDTSRYEPDFVVETENIIYMVETKAANEVNTDVVKGKAAAGWEYCRAVSEWNRANGGKVWEYALIRHDEVRLNASFITLVKNSVPID